MNSLTLTTSLDSLRDNGIATLYGEPQHDEGPIAFIFDPIATYPGADYNETFAAAATLSQNGKTLAVFKAFAAETFGQHCTSEFYQEGSKFLKALPNVSTYRELGTAFGIFYLACWKLCWDAMEPLIKNDKDFVPGDWLNSRGYMGIFHSGLLNHVERQFFHQSRPEEQLRNNVLGKVSVSTTLCHPYAIHPLCSVFEGMGYQPNLEEHKNALNLPYTHYRDVANETHRLTALYWAARRRDPRLEPFQLWGR